MVSSPIYYHVQPIGLSVGTVLPKGSYGRYLWSQGMSTENDPLQELLREEIRQLHYSGKPSRLSSSFVFDSLQDAIFFRDKLRPHSHIYQVKFCNQPAIVHRVCYTAWNNSFPNPQMQAHDFWNSPPVYSSNTELFAEEDLVIVSL